METTTDIVGDNARAVPEGAADHAEPLLSREAFIVIALLIGSAFTVILNETTMALALAQIKADLGVSASIGQWLTTGFMLTMAVVIPSTGFLINRLGTRKAFLLAMTLFNVGVLLAILAPGFGVLVAARVVQATGTAVMLPLLMTTIMTVVPPAIRGRVMGNLTLVIAVAPAIGPFLSGVILNWFGWRMIFVVMLPIAMTALIAGALWIRDVGQQDEHPLDLVSLPLVLVAFGGLVWGLNAFGEIQQEGGALLSPWLPTLVGLAVLGLFIWRQITRQRTDNALLDLRTFRSRNFRVSVAIMTLAMAGMFGTLIMLPLVMQDAMGFEPLWAGALMLPGGLAMGFLGPPVGRLYDRYGPRPILIPGIALVTLSIAALAFMMSPVTPWPFLLIAHIVLMIGLATVFTPLMSASMAELEMHLYSHGSATISTVQQVAGAAGTALFVALMTIRSSALVDDGVSTAEALAGGAQLAFSVGAVIMAVAVSLSLLVKRVT